MLMCWRTCCHWMAVRHWWCRSSRSTLSWQSPALCQSPCPLVPPSRRPGQPNTHVGRPLPRRPAHAAPGRPGYVELSHRTPQTRGVLGPSLSRTPGEMQCQPSATTESGIQLRRRSDVMCHPVVNSQSAGSDRHSSKTTACTRTRTE